MSDWVSVIITILTVLALLYTVRLNRMTKQCLAKIAKLRAETDKVMGRDDK